MKNKPHAQASGHALRTTRRNTRRLRAALVPLLFALMGTAHARKPVSVEPLKHDAHEAHEAKSQADKRDAHRVTPRRVSSSQHALRAHRRLQTGIASWYGREFHGHRTANGERFDMYALTAAHRTLPFGSFARVTLPATGRSVIVRINDRGPYARGRVIDLSFGAARVLGYSSAGSARVRIEPVAARQASALQGTRRAKRPVRRAKPTPPPKAYRAR
ncbi:septal ring lytic transglycosylase RlpA family protein [Paraburkholderia tropica]|uniref:septal ring lytic transglycosylase RlpA family protein n=1 Tax=Paraburkholderia tropica TaxID=92647 RepID=UPI001CC80BE4|nr:septal ring lytic transglycosylase RlpA family protein [Paraburkholderia tropica]